MRMPLKDDAAVKEYLLSPAYRACLLASSSSTSSNGTLPTCTRQDGSCTGQGTCSEQSCDQRKVPSSGAARAVTANGAVWHTIARADALQPLLMDPSFVCLHYKLGPGATLQACALEDDAGSCEGTSRRYAR